MIIFWWCFGRYRRNARLNRISHFRCSALVPLLSLTLPTPTRELSTRVGCFSISPGSPHPDTPHQHQRTRGDVSRLLHRLTSPVSRLKVGLTQMLQSFFSCHGNQRPVNDEFEKKVVSVKCGHVLSTVIDPLPAHWLFDEEEKQLRKCGPFSTSGNGSKVLALHQ